MRRLQDSGRLLFLAVGLASAWLLVPASTVRADGKKYAFLVGINVYERPNMLPNLEYAENDVTELAQFLRTAGFETIVLTDGTAKVDSALKPTKSNIELQLARQLKKCDSDDLLLIGLTGHGVYFDKTKESYFCPQDAQPSLDAKGLASLIPLRHLYKQLEDGSPAAKLILIDACRDDPTRNVGITKQTTPVPPQSTAALFSCSTGQVAWEVKIYQHGLFFYYVLEGLKGKARNEEGNITWSRLEEYVRTQVSREAPKLVGRKIEQTPAHVGELIGEPLVLIHGIVPTRRDDASLVTQGRASLDILLDAIDRPTADRCKLPQGLQPEIVFVIPGGGGERMGLKRGDVIARVDDREVTSAKEFFRVLGEHKLGDNLEVTVLRDGVRRSLKGKYESRLEESAAFERVTTLARDDGAAQHALAYLYATGRGVSKDMDLATQWYRKAAEQGFVQAQRELARRYRTGAGVKKDEAEAANWYRKAADQGDAESQKCLALLYEHGQGVQKDIKEAGRWLQKAAEQGNPLAQYDLGSFYTHGRLGEPDYREAIKWYRKAADAGLAEAQNSLGVLCSKGQGVDKDDAEAVRWYRKAAELGNTWGMCNLAAMYADGRGVEKDYNEAVKWYRKASDLNHAQAINNLGVLYEHGNGVDKSFDEAVKLYRKAADLGNSWAQYNLGSIHHDGRLGKVDDVEALQLFRKAADQSLPQAQNMLGVMLQDGHGTSPDPEMALIWFEKAAKQGYGQGQFHLGVCFEMGIGTKADRRLAVEWYRKAAAQGVQNAKTALARLESTASQPTTPPPPPITGRRALSGQ
jgi:TPR repeat protein